MVIKDAAKITITLQAKYYRFDESNRKSNLMYKKISSELQRDEFYLTESI